MVRNITPANCILVTCLAVAVIVIVRLTVFAGPVAAAAANTPAAFSTPASMPQNDETDADGNVIPNTGTTPTTPAKDPEPLNGYARGDLQVRCYQAAATGFRSQFAGPGFFDRAVKDCLALVAAIK